MTLKFDSLTNLTQDNLHQIINILQSHTDITSCLTNCSNQGVCKLDPQIKKYICECNANFMGKSCQIDARPCSQANKCLNNGTCTNSLDLTSFTCQCPQNSPYYGQYCEHLRILCENVTCSSHGYCTQSQSQTKCKCYMGYDGENCETESNSIKAVKYVQWTATIICIICLTIFCIIIVSNDLLNYFKICNERIDITEWKREKLYGKEDKPAKKAKKKLKIKKRTISNKDSKKSIKST